MYVEQLQRVKTRFDAVVNDSELNSNGRWRGTLLEGNDLERREIHYICAHLAFLNMVKASNISERIDTAEVYDEKTNLESYIPEIYKLISMLHLGK